jgi:NAD-dependent isocitrate dehydrogenase
MAKQQIGVIPGDGIGPEIMDATIRVLEQTGFEADWVFLDAGLSAIEKGLPAMPEATIETIRKLGIGLKSPTTTPVGKGHVSANVALRKALDLFANVRPSKSIPGVKTSSTNKEIDIIIVRENTEDLYSGIEYMPHPDVAQSIKVITRDASSRLFKYTFDMARKQGRKLVTVVHKANIMKISDGLFIEEFYKAAALNKDIEANDIIVDNCCMQLVMRPEKFDVLVTQNLYGDILSDLCAGLVGGLGLAPGANIGVSCAVFEAVHGSAPDIAGKGIANPTALLMSAVMMLHHLGHHGQADLISNSILKVCGEGNVVTGDLGGTATTTEYIEELLRVARLQKAIA